MKKFIDWLYLTFMFGGALLLFVVAVLLYFGGFGVAWLFLP